MNQDYYKQGADTLRYKPTTLEEERELFLKARSGDMAAREFLIKNHLLFVANRARGLVRGKLPSDVVISAANEALMVAIDRFDPSHGCRFTHYLYSYIQGAIARLWKDQGVVRNVKTCEFAEYDEADELDQDGQHRKPRWIHYDIKSMVSSPLEEKVASERKQARLAELHRGMAALTHKERTLLRLVYEQEKTFAEIARARGVSRQAIEQAVDRIIEKMRGVMKHVA